MFNGSKRLSIDIQRTKERKLGREKAKEEAFSKGLQQGTRKSNMVKGMVWMGIITICLYYAIILPNPAVNYNTNKMLEMVDYATALPLAFVITIL